MNGKPFLIHDKWKQNTCNTKRNTRCHFHRLLQHASWPQTSRSWSMPNQTWNSQRWLILTTARVVNTQAVVYARVTGGICMYSCWNVCAAMSTDAHYTHAYTSALHFPFSVCARMRCYRKLIPAGSLHSSGYKQTKLDSARSPAKLSPVRSI